jgi:hypothetical protein
MKKSAILLPIMLSLVCIIIFPMENEPKTYKERLNTETKIENKSIETENPIIKKHKEYLAKQNAASPFAQRLMP